MFKLVGIIFATCVLFGQNGEAAPTALQTLPEKDGFVPVYIRNGNTPLADINPELAEAFRESNVMQTREVKAEEEKSAADQIVPSAKSDEKKPQEKKDQPDQPKAKRQAAEEQKPDEGKPSSQEQTKPDQNAEEGKGPQAPPRQRRDSRVEAAPAPQAAEPPKVETKPETKIQPPVEPRSDANSREDQKSNQQQ